MMKNYVVAAALAIAAVAPTYNAAHAQSVIIEDGDGPNFHHRHHGPDWDRGRWDHRDRWDRRDRHHVRDACTTRREEIHRHGHTIVKTVSDC